MTRLPSDMLFSILCWMISPAWRRKEVFVAPAGVRELASDTVTVTKSAPRILSTILRDGPGDGIATLRATGLTSIEPRPRVSIRGELHRSAHPQSRAPRLSIRAVAVR